MNKYILSDMQCNINKKLFLIHIICLKYPFKNCDTEKKLIIE